MASRGTIKAWVDRAARAINPDEQVAYEELLSYVRVEPNELIDEDDGSDIAKFYENQSVFITGASGFLGKSILEKLLRSCPKIKEIFVLIRPKRGVDIETRCKLMLHLSLFDRIRDKPNGPKILATKIIPIAGDITKPYLGLSQSDLLYICTRVSIVINSAASIRFIEPVAVSTQLNVNSVDNFLNVCNRMTKLKSIVHISTCYCHCNRSVIEEIFYETPIDPYELMQLARDAIDNPEINEKLEKLLKKTNRPNSYTLTKAVGETLCLKRSIEFTTKGIAFSIVRPSIVCATWREPLKGWVDNTYAATGLICGLASGSASLFWANSNLGADIIPVDMIANIIIATNWAICTQPEKFQDVCIFNASSGSFNRVDWDRCVKQFNELALKYPYDGSVRSPGSIFITNRFIYRILAQFDNLWVAKSQFIYNLMGKEEPSLMDNKKAMHRNNTLGYFTNREWLFTCSKTRMLWDSMSRIDREIFHFSVTALDWKNYFRSYYVGSKIFVYKDNPDNLLNYRRSIAVSERISALIPYIIIGILTILLIYRGITTMDSN